MFAMHARVSHASASGTRAPDLRALVLLNAALLIVLGAVTFSSSAGAQARGRGDYTMVGGGVNGAEASAVYVADASNQELIALTFNVNTRRLEGIGYRNLALDAARVTQRPGN
jgi:hypothetical protein